MDLAFRIFGLICTLNQPLDKQLSICHPQQEVIQHPKNLATIKKRFNIQRQDSLFLTEPQGKHQQIIYLSFKCLDVTVN